MILCVDTGGTKTLVAEFDARGRLGRSHRFPTPRDPHEYIRKLSTLITHEFNLLGVSAISLGIPGEIEHNRVAWCTNLPWENTDFARMLGTRTHFTRPIILENDVNLAGLGEARALRPVPAKAMYLTVSTGINACLVADGALLPALNRNEAGHMVVEYKGNVIEWESLASGRAFYDLYGQYARDITDPAIWHEIAEKISRGLLDLIPMFQPDVIIFGGGVGAYFERFGADLAQFLDKGLHAHLVRPKLVKAKHPEEAVVYGGFQNVRHVAAR